MRHDFQESVKQMVEETKAITETMRELAERAANIALPCPESLESLFDMPGMTLTQISQMKCLPAKDIEYVGKLRRRGLSESLEGRGFDVWAIEKRVKACGLQDGTIHEYVVSARKGLPDSNGNCEKSVEYTVIGATLDEALEKLRVTRSNWA